MDNEKTKSGIATLFILILSVFLLIYIIRAALRLIRRHRGFSSADRRAGLYNRYRHLYEVCAFADNLGGREMSYDEFFDYMSSRRPAGQTPADFCERFEKALFSGAEITADEFGALVSLLKSGIAQLRKEMKAAKKIRYYFIDILW